MPWAVIATRAEAAVDRFGDRRGALDAAQRAGAATTCGLWITSPIGAIGAVVLGGVLDDSSARRTPQQ